MLVGNLRLLKEHGVNVSGLPSCKDEWEQGGKTVALVAINRRIAGLIAVADTIKPSSRSAIRHLQALGMRVVMVSGDNVKTSNAVAREVGIGDVLAELTPEDKVRVIRHFQRQRYSVAMVGDGINDAPALAAADVGLAVGTGTDVALEAADVALIGADLEGVVQAILLSRATMRCIVQSFSWALLYNGITIPFAAIGWLNPLLAGAAMAFSSVTVVLNALRLKRMKIGGEEGVFTYRSDEPGASHSRSVAPVLTSSKISRSRVVNLCVACTSNSVDKRSRSEFRCLPRPRHTLNRGPEFRRTRTAECDCSLYPLSKFHTSSLALHERILDLSRAISCQVV